MSAAVLSFLMPSSFVPLVVSAVGTADWPHSGRDSANTSANLDESVINSSNVGRLSPVWRQTAFDQDFAAISGSGVVFSSCSRGLCDINGDTGAMLWTSPDAHYGPAVAGGIVYGTLDSPARVTAIDAATGTTKWQRTLFNGAIRAPLTVFSGVVYAGGDNGYLYALDTTSGNLNWSFWGNFDQPYGYYPIVAQPALSGGTLYFSAGANELQAVDPSTGTLLWLGFPGGGPPTVADGLVLVGATVGSNNLNAYAVGGCGQPRCSPVWSHEFGAHNVTAAAVASNIGYVVGDYRLYAFDVTTGQMLWQSAADPFAAPWSAPVVANDVVYVGTANGGLSAYPAAGCGASECASLWTSRVGRFGEQEPQPIVINGTVYENSGLGLHAFRLLGDGTQGPQPPGQATNITASISPLGGYVTLNFTKAPDGDYPVTAYLVVASPHDVADQEIDGAFDHGLITGVLYGEVHTFTLTAFSAAGAGVVSRPSTPVGDTNIPPTPDGVGGIPGRTSVEVEWNRGSGNANGYTIYRNGAAVGTVPGTQLYFFDEGLSPGTTYYYSVDAYNLAGHSAASDPIAVTTYP